MRSWGWDPYTDGMMSLLWEKTETPEMCAQEEKTKDILQLSKTRA